MVAMGKLVFTGLLEALVLTECSDSPSSGKEIRERIEWMTSGKWIPSPGTVYPAMESLCKKGFLKKEIGKKGSGRVREGIGAKEIRYSTTASGAKRLRELREEMKHEFEDNAVLVVPLLLRATRGYSVVEAAEMRDHMKVFVDAREKFLHMPPKARNSFVRIVKRICSCK
jgi:DNA-binding PadR family transcriptional regulator